MPETTTDPTPQWRALVTLRVKIGRNGLYMVEADGVDGFCATGRSLTDAMADVPVAFRELADVGVEIAEELRNG